MTKYEKVAADIRQRIRTGQLKPGDRLPPISGLCEKHRVSYGTVRSAMLVLKAERLVVGRHGKAAALLRTRLAGRRVLLLLDNAISEEQVQPLLPGTPGCRVRHQPAAPDRLGRRPGGSSWDYVVQLHVVHSGKCLHVSGASTANGATIVQTGCAGTPPPNRQFILRLEP